MSLPRRRRTFSTSEPSYDSTYDSTKCGISARVMTVSSILVVTWIIASSPLISVVISPGGGSLCQLRYRWLRYMYRQRWPALTSSSILFFNVILCGVPIYVMILAILVGISIGRLMVFLGGTKRLVVSALVSMRKRLLFKGL